MTTATHLPIIDDAAKFFGDLLGTQATATECSDFESSNINVFARYTDSDTDTRHFVACDIHSGAILGAALTGFPPSLVEESVAAGTLPENVFGNLQEVLNIAVGVFPQSNQRRIVIENISQGQEAIDAYNACEGTPETAFKLSIPRYGDGVIVVGAT